MIVSGEIVRLGVARLHPISVMEIKTRKSSNYMEILESYDYDMTDYCMHKSWKDIYFGENRECKIL